jgi:hypothetical protein
MVRARSSSPVPVSPYDRELRCLPTSYTKNAPPAASALPLQKGTDFHM